MPYPQENLVSSSRSISARAASSNLTFSTLASSMATWLWKNNLETTYAIKVYFFYLWITQILIHCIWSTFNIVHGNLGGKDVAIIAFKKGNKSNIMKQLPEISSFKLYCLCTYFVIIECLILNLKEYYQRPQNLFWLCVLNLNKPFCNGFTN